jgi:hypothetical protein
MYKNKQIQILIIVSALSTLIIINAVQYQQQQQQQHLLAFGQTPPETSVAGEQTFRSAFDTLFLQNQEDMVSMRRGNLMCSNQEKHSCYMLNL